MRNPTSCRPELSLWGNQNVPIDTSYSAIATFLECPRRYKKRYIEGKGDYHSYSIEMYYGGVIHQSLRQFFSSPTEQRTLDSLLDIVRSRWKPKAETSADTNQLWLEKAEIVLKRFYLTHDAAIDPVALEKPFRLSLRNGRIIGRVDRIDSVQGVGIRLWDYKTCEAPMSQEEAEKDLQSTVYCLAFHKPPFTEVGEFVYSFVDFGVDVCTTKTLKPLAKMIEEVEEIMDRMIAEDEFAPRATAHCGLCLWRHDCEPVLRQPKAEVADPLNNHDDRQSDTDCCSRREHL